MIEMSNALGHPATKDRLDAYWKALGDIQEFPLKYALDLALKNLGQFLPSIEVIRTYSEQYRPVDPIAETREYLKRDDKPTDWVALGRKNGVTKEEIAQWLEEGKQAQREVIAKLAADPVWQLAAGRAGVPGYRQFSENLAAERNGKSEIPADPAARGPWARKKAVEMGWSEGREPGDEA